ncbi:MAG: lipid-binding SYLF domain-containing protein [Bryobacteraceae bacterium]
MIIVPGLFKGPFLFGGKYGRGFASCRRPGGWSAPAAMIIEGGNFGIQLGGSATDLVLLVMNQVGMDHLLHDKFTLGADLAVVQGIGYDSSANTDVFMRASMISWSRSKGLFVGLSLEGASLRPGHRQSRNPREEHSSSARSPSLCHRLEPLRAEGCEKKVNRAAGLRGCCRTAEAQAARDHSGEREAEEGLTRSPRTLQVRSSPTRATLQTAWESGLGPRQ